MPSQREYTLVKCRYCVGEPERMSHTYFCVWCFLCLPALSVSRLSLLCCFFCLPFSLPRQSLCSAVSYTCLSLISSSVSCLSVLHLSFHLPFQPLSKVLQHPAERQSSYAASLSKFLITLWT